MSAPSTVEDYLAGLPGAQRQALEHLRRTIRAAAPDAEERIGYGIPTVRYRGKMLVSYGAAKEHLALYAVSHPTLAALADALGDRVTGKNTVRFTPDDPLPDDLVAQIVAARVAEIDA